MWAEACTHGDMQFSGVKWRFFFSCYTEKFDYIYQPRALILCLKQCGKAARQEGSAACPVKASESSE